MSKEIRRKIFLIIFITAFLAAVYFLIGRPMLSFVSDYNSLKAYIDSKGILGFVIFTAFVVVQTVSNCIPGTPFYLAAGFILGGFKGALLCDLGATIGNTIAFLLGRKFGKKILLNLISEKQLEKTERYIDEKNPILIHVLFMLLPLPKDTYAWLGYYSGENVLQWILITFICRFPHIFVYTYGGAMILQRNYAVVAAGAVFAVLVYVFLMFYFKRNKSSGK